MFTETVPPATQETLPLDAQLTDARAKIPTVSQLTRIIRAQLENTFFDVWVKGEISNFKKPSSGHAYFVLKDSTAQLRSVMFRPSISKVKFQVQDGMEVLLHGRVTVYEARGDYQIIVDAMEPVGVGALQLAFEQLKKKLKTEGLFEQEHKKPLPFLPRRIGIVTSATGAAVRDILKVLSRRFPNRHILIFPTSVQGEKAAPEIVNAIDLAEKWNETYPLKPIDVLIVGRGGGSLEDLWPFNEEIVARRIFQCQIPIISAVGHEIDFTIADFVADVRAPTPSAAAEIVIPQFSELTNRIQMSRERLALGIDRKVDQLRLHLGHLSRRLVDPIQKIREARQRFTVFSERLSLAYKNRRTLARKRLETIAQMLNSLSPLNVLGRGFSITEDGSGHILRSIKEVAPGSVLVTRLSDGVLRSRTI